MLPFLEVKKQLTLLRRSKLYLLVSVKDTEQLAPTPFQKATANNLLARDPKNVYPVRAD